MSLSSALDTAKSALIASQTHTALVSRNIANLNDPGATRKYANVVTGPGGRVEIASIARSHNAVLYRNMLESTSQVGSWTALANGFQRIHETVGDTSLGRSPAARIGNLADALAAYSGNPGKFEFARTVLDGARDLASGLNDLSLTVETVRRDADDALAAAAGDMNAILAEIATLNGRVVSGTVAGSDVTDFIDRRDQAVQRLAQHVGVTARIRGDNDLVLHTDSGVTLFDQLPRAVEFTPTSPLRPGVAGSILRIDGVEVTGPGAAMPLRSGAVVGLVELRDEVTITAQRQLDEIARGLVLAFRETNPALAGDRRTGLFGTEGVDLAAIEAGPVEGLAALLRVDPRVAADPSLIRDGINFDFAGDAGSGFTGRINALSEALGSARDFAGSAGLDTRQTLAGFAASSLGWLQAGRGNALEAAEYRMALLDRTSETLSNETGINLASEMTLLTDLQRSYQASARIISTVDEMLATLLQTV